MGIFLDDRPGKNAESPCIPVASSGACCSDADDLSFYLIREGAGSQIGKCPAGEESHVEVLEESLFGVSFLGGVIGSDFG